MAAKKDILVVEDEKDLAELVRYNLEREGHTCRCVFDGDGVLAEVKRRQPDLIILDRMLPGLSGDEVADQLRRELGRRHLPILMLTAKADESDEMVGFALGADDYVTKPFSMKVLMARVAAVLRRRDAAGDDRDVLSAGPIVLDAGRHELTVHGEMVTVTPTEFRLLKALMAAGGRVLERNRLIDVVMGQTVAVTDRTIDVHVTGLRRKLGDAGAWVKTIRGVGYAFREPS